MTDVRDFFYTICTATEEEQNIQRSRFIAYAYPVSSIDEVQLQLQVLREQHHSATHICWAYSLYAPDEYRVRCSDDGEPSGTAGKPILARIQAADLTNIFVAVVRYFGGVKLGPSGLIDAYRSSTQLALDRCDRCEVILYDEWCLSFEVHLMGIAMQLIKRLGAEIIKQDYTDRYYITLRIRRGDSTRFRFEVERVYGFSLSEVSPLFL